MKHSSQTKWLLVIAIIVLPIVVIFGYLFATGQAHIVKDNWKVTTALITLKQHPSSLSATIMAGEGFYGLRKYQRAAEYYLTATTMSPDADFVWNSLGNTYRELSLYSEAESAYKQAIVIKSNVAIYYSNLADLYKRLPEMQGSRDKQIVQTLEDGLKATDNDKILLNAIIDYYQQLGDTKKVEKYQVVLDSQPK
jgi:tetratricopeptide (TPR) repeat protein